jgi:hypothetical protein
MTCVDGLTFNSTVSASVLWTQLPQPPPQLCRLRLQLYDPGLQGLDPQLLGQEALTAALPQPVADLCHGQTVLLRCQLLLAEGDRPLHPFQIQNRFRHPLPQRLSLRLYQYIQLRLLVFQLRRCYLPLTHTTTPQNIGRQLNGVRRQPGRPAIDPLAAQATLQQRRALLEQRQLPTLLNRALLQRLQTLRLPGPAG